MDGVLAVVGKEGEDYKALLEGSSAPKAAAPATDNGQQTTGKTEQAATAAAKVALPAGAKEIRMPLLSDTMTEGKIVSWNKKVGDTVKGDDVLADVETDKPPWKW